MAEAWTSRQYRHTQQNKRRERLVPDGHVAACGGCPDGLVTFWPTFAAAIEHVAAEHPTDSVTISLYESGPHTIEAG